MKDMLTQEEYDALRRYAYEHGRRWKQDLRVAWMRGEPGGVLLVLRDSRRFGPAGLDRYRFPRCAECGGRNGQHVEGLCTQLLAGGVLDRE